MASIKLPKAILFDADGTLYDSEALNYEANRRTAKLLHDFDMTWDDFDIHVRRGTKSGFMILEETGIVVDREAYLSNKAEQFRILVVERLQPQPGLVPFLEWCTMQHIRCSVVSASRRVQLLTALGTLKIDHFFEDVVSMENIDERPKPNPYPYELGLKRLGIEPHEGLVIEDTPKGIASAKAAGLRCVAIRNTTNSLSELAAADFVITHYTELQGLLLVD
jgi:HAD superfamily hydrolase (TIGR01509 family)